MKYGKPFTVPQFLTSVPLPARLVLERHELTLASIDECLTNEELPPGGSPVCELQIGGDTVAVGRIVRRFGRSYFQVQSLVQGSQS